MRQIVKSDALVNLWGLASGGRLADLGYTVVHRQVW